MSDGDTETDKKSSCDEHTDIDGDALQNHPEDHDDTADYDTHTTTKAVSDVWDKWNSAYGTNRHDGVEYTEYGVRRVVEVVLPWRQCLETVHHRSIVTVGGRCEDDEAQADVSLSHGRVLVPCNARELASSQLKVVLTHVGGGGD